MNTLDEVKSLIQQELIEGIVETMQKESELLRYLGWRNAVSHTIEWNIETGETNVEFYSRNEDVAEGTPAWAKRTAALVRLGGDCDLDRLDLKLAVGGRLQSDTMTLRAQATARTFEKYAIYGLTSTTTNEKQLKGLLRLIAEVESTSTTDLDAVNNTQVVAYHATSATIAVDCLDALADALVGDPNCFMLNKLMRRKIKSLLRAAGTNLTLGEGKFGTKVEYYGTVPVVINDFIPSNMDDNDGSSVNAIQSWSKNQTRAATHDNSPIFALQFEEKKFTGFQPGAMEVIPVGILQKKDAVRVRLMWYPGLALINPRAAAVLTGATDGT